MLLANENTYRKLSTFQSVEKLNEAVKAHKQTHALSPTERAVLDVISRYACKYPGVCYLSKNKIGEAVGKVRRTVIRVCQRLEALGIIKQYETKRETGDRRQSTNVIVILAFRNSEVGLTSGSMAEKGTQNGYTFEEDEMPIMGNYKAQVTPDMSRQEAPAIKLNNINYINTYYKPFYARFKAFIGSTIGKDSQRIISRLYGVYLSHSKPLLAGNAFDKGSVEHIGFQALKTAVMASKNKRIKNLAGYFNGILDRMLDKLYFGEMGELGGL